MFYHRFCQLFGFTASLTCDKIEQILLNSLSTFYRLVWRSRQPEDKTLSSEKCFMTFYRRNNLQSVLEMFARCSTVEVCRRRSASAETLTANCSWVGSRGSSNHEIVLIFQNAVIMISFLQIPPSQNCSKYTKSSPTSSFHLPYSSYLLQLLFISSASSFFLFLHAFLCTPCPRVFLSSSSPSFSLILSSPSVYLK